MVENKGEYTTATGKTFSSANVPVWTIASAAVPNSDEPILLGNNNQDMPNSDTLPIPSATDIGDVPPNYFDISIVPNNAILHYNDVVPYTEPSKAVVERRNEGVLSFDPLINRNPDQLWLYFMTYLNEKPTVGVTIHGYHLESYTVNVQSRGPNGASYTSTQACTRNVTDFNLTLDLTQYVSQQWWRVAVVPSKKTIKSGEMVSLRDAIEQYTQSEKNIKEIVCQKQLVGWNFQEVQNHITGIIYSTGYRSHINITFQVNNNRITARSSSKMSRFSNSRSVRVLCVFSWLFLIFGPIYLCLRAAGSTKDHVVADYVMAAPSDTFLRLNAGLIANAARFRLVQHLTANLL